MLILFITQHWKSTKFWLVLVERCSYQVSWKFVSNFKIIKGDLQTNTDYTLTWRYHWYVFPYKI